MHDNLARLTENTSRLIKVLLIEDSKEDYLLTQRQLAGKRFDLVWAESLTEALQYLKENQFDVILLDLALPDNIGLSTFDTVYAQVNPIPIIVLCGLDNDLVVSSALQRGAQDYLVKGKTTPALLERALTYAIDRKRMDWAQHYPIHQILKYAPLAIAMLDKDLAIVETNLDFSKHMRIATESLVGNNILSLLPDLPKHLFEQALQNKTPSLLEHHSMKSQLQGEGTKLYWDLAIWPIIDQHEGITGAIFLAKQMTVV